MDFSAILSDALRSGIGPIAAVYALAAMGLNLHFGYTGLLNFGQVGFMLVGGYGLAITVSTYDGPMWLGVLGGVACAIVLALLLGLPTLRLRADYLAIVTIAAAEIIRQTVGAAAFSETFGGQDGITDFIPGFRAANPYDGPIDLGIVSWGAYDFWVMTVGWSLVAVCCVIVWLLMRSPWGRVLKSIREDENAVRSLGKNVYSYKMQALIIGGVIGGLAGMMTSLRSAAVGPSFFATDVTFFAYTALLIGGAARVLGPVIGAVIFWFLINFFGSFFSQATGGADPLIPTWIMDSNQASIMRFILVGLGLMLLMIFRPQGIIGDRRELAIDAR
jgi:neutral amino acid transport system permease protein